MAACVSKGCMRWLTVKGSTAGAPAKRADTLSQRSRGELKSKCHDEERNEFKILIRL